jgi:hypothetical protein
MDHHLDQASHSLHVSEWMFYSTPDKLDEKPYILLKALIIRPWMR